MKVVKFEEEARRLNVPVEAIKRAFEKSVNEGKIQGIIDAEYGEIICYEPEEMKSLARRLISERVSLEQLANELNLKKDHVSLIIKFLEEKRGSFTDDREYVSAFSAKEKEAFLCPFCGAPYKEIIPLGTFQVKCAYCKATIIVPRKIGGSFQSCSNHPEMLAAGLCNDCGKRFCGDCLFVTKLPQYYQQMPEYSYFCSGCLKRKGLKGTMFPTAHMVTEKISELNVRVERLKATMSPQEVEDLYKNMDWPFIDPWTGEWTWESNLLKKYMESGLSRREAIFKIAEANGLEIRPGLHNPPTIDDAISELKKEMEEAMLTRISKESGELYEKLLHVYTTFYGGGREALEYEIGSRIKMGLNREEAIRRLAIKEKLIKTEQ